MIFQSAAYFILFLIPASVAFRLASPKWRPWVCAFSGMIFFVYFSLQGHGGWLGAACLVLLIWEAAFSRLYRPRTPWPTIGIVSAIGILVALKYRHWFVLPLGISFFTFEFIHYAIERKRGTIDREPFSHYLAFLFFFPAMVAGPIKRVADFTPQLQNPSENWALDWHRGITRILCGLAKKFALADFLTSLTAHLVVKDILAAPRWALVLWLVAYSWKIYFDFSAYSDIAIGSARLFGIQLPENFAWPYFRRNIAEFWKHWHMSLTRWLTDYVFIPLGGSRGGTALTCRNLVVVMLVSGIWHGVGWHFVAWGAWHGGLLAVHRIWSHVVTAPERPSVWRRGLSGITTYAAVTTGWAFFAMDLTTVELFFRRLLLG